MVDYSYLELTRSAVGLAPLKFKFLFYVAVLAKISLNTSPRVCFL